MTEFYAYASFLNVVMTYGMETALFNFSAKRDRDPAVYSTALFSLFLTSAIFLTALTLQAQSIAQLLDYPLHTDYVLWMTWVIGLDALTAIPFARLREQQKAVRFAVLKTLNIFINIAANLIFIGLGLTLYKTPTDIQWLAWANQLYNPEIGIGYVFISNLIASAVTVVLMLPELFAVTALPKLRLWGQMLRYAIPLLIAGLAGMVNETMDRVLLKYLLPESIALEQLGIYGACYKISILMSIFIQAFRYAAEPFFFSHYKKADGREIYALVLRWFVITCSFIFLAVMANIAWVQYFVGAHYRTGLAVVPILLMANLCLGVFFNLSIWYKLTEQTRFGTYLTLWGAAVTLALNFYWIPRIGYMGAAWATLICYASMAIWSYLLGQKFYKVPYDVKRLIGYPLLALAAYLWLEKISATNLALELTAKNSFLLIFIAAAYLLERRKKSQSPSAVIDQRD